MELDVVDEHDAIALLLAARDEPAVKDQADYREAEALAASDPALRDRWRDEEAYYAAHGDLLDAVRLDESTREAMRARVEAALADQTPAVPTGRLLAWPFGHPALAIAAAVVMLAAGVLLLRGTAPFGPSVASASPMNIDAFAEQAAAVVADGLQLDYQAGDPAELVRWLASERGIRIDGIHPELMALNSMGCKVLEWNGARVAMICFLTSDQKLAHLFVTSRDNLDLSGATEQLGNSQWRDREVFSWINQGQAFVIVAHDKGQRLNVLPGLSV